MAEPALPSATLLGRWFYAHYGFEIVVGQCAAVDRDGNYVLRFRWGNPYRTFQHVEKDRIISEANDPRWFSRIWNLLKRPNTDSAK